MAVPGPFTVTPAAGAIEPHGKVKITVAFKPDGARRYNCNGSIKYDAGMGGRGAAGVLLEGCAQYPYIKCGLPAGEAIQFKSTAINSRKVEMLTLTNVSPVPASYKVVRGAGPAALEGLGHEGQRFKVISNASGVVQPGESTVAKVS